MRKHLPMFFAAFAGVTVAVPVLSALDAQEYDLVIHNGRVMDPERKFDGIANPYNPLRGLAPPK